MGAVKSNSISSIASQLHSFIISIFSPYFNRCFNSYGARCFNSYDASTAMVLGASIYYAVAFLQEGEPLQRGVWSIECPKVFEEAMLRDKKDIS